jgi:hypothetical protein
LIAYRRPSTRLIAATTTPNPPCPSRSCSKNSDWYLQARGCKAERSESGCGRDTSARHEASHLRGLAAAPSTAWDAGPDRGAEMLTVLETGSGHPAELTRPRHAVPWPCGGVASRRSRSPPSQPGASVATTAAQKSLNTSGSSRSCAALLHSVRRPSLLRVGSIRTCTM